MLLVDIEGNAGKSKSSSVIKFRESILAEAKGNKIITSLVLSTHGPSRHSFAQCMCYTSAAASRYALIPRLLTKHGPRLYRMFFILTLFS